MRDDEPMAKSKSAIAGGSSKLKGIFDDEDDEEEEQKTPNPPPSMVGYAAPQ
jgi:hypothetical protein